MNRSELLRRRVQRLLLFAVANLLFWGAATFPLVWEAEAGARLLGIGAVEEETGLFRWLATVRDGLVATGADYPFIFYGTDWLGFVHILLAILLIGPLRDPVGNVWVVTFMLIASALIIPTALIFGPIREIAFGWQMMDCGFGGLGIVIFGVVRRAIVELRGRGGSQA